MLNEIIHNGEIGQLIHQCFWGDTIIFDVVRFSTTTRVFVVSTTTQKTIDILSTWIAPWASNAPKHGDAYYWTWSGLNHSTPAIVPNSN